MNIFRRLSQLVPEAPLLVGQVIEHHEDDTSSVRLPIGIGLQTVGGTVATGAVIRPRGRTVPVGKWAFVRRGLIESEAPGGEPVQVVVGKITVPPPAPAPAPNPGELTGPWPSFLVRDFLFAAGRYIAVGESTAEVAVSDDGITYHARTMPSVQTWSVVGNTGDAWMALSDNSTAAARSSDGGITWTAVTLPVSKTWVQIATTSNLAMAMATDGTVITSADGGATWVVRAPAPLPVTRHSLIVGPALPPAGTVFIAADQDGRLVTSTDGTSWTQVSSGTMAYAAGLAYESSVGYVMSGGIDNAALNPARFSATLTSNPWSIVDNKENGFISYEAIYRGNVMSGGGGYMHMTPQYIPSRGVNRIPAVNGSGNMFEIFLGGYLPSGVTDIGPGRIAYSPAGLAFISSPIAEGRAFRISTAALQGTTNITAEPAVGKTNRSFVLQGRAISNAVVRSTTGVTYVAGADYTITDAANGVITPLAGSALATAISAAGPAGMQLRVDYTVPTYSPVDYPPLGA